MDSKKMAVALAVSIVAITAAITATAHSRKVLAQERSVFPPDVLEVGEPATVNGCEMRIDDADVAESVASADTTGSNRRMATGDWRFARLSISVENNSSSPVSLKELCDGLRVIQTATDEPVAIEVVWLRGYDALPQKDLAPGEREAGKIAVHISGYTLIFPFIVEIGSARWGVDVIARDAPVQDTP